MPSVSVASSTPDSYFVIGNSTNYSAGGVSNGTYSATVRPMANPVNSFMSGYAQGAALGEMLRARRDQDEIYRGCMTRLGWVVQ